MSLKSMISSLPSCLLLLSLIEPLVQCDYPPLDGYGNNLAHPTFGTSGSHYLRLLAPAAFADNVSAMASPDAPSPLLISNLVFPANGRLSQNTKRISDFAAFWGQFLAHDIILTTNDPVLNFTIPVPDCVFDTEDRCDGIKVISAICSIHHQRLILL